MFSKSGLSKAVVKIKYLFPRYTRKLRLLTIKFVIVLWLIIILFWLNLHQNTNVTSFYNPYTPLRFSRPLESELDKKFVTLLDKLYPPYFEKSSTQVFAMNSTVYPNIFQEDSHLLQILLSLDFDQRCQLYFNSAIHQNDLKLQEISDSEEQKTLPVVNLNEAFIFDSKFFKPVHEFIPQELRGLKQALKDKVKHAKTQALIEQKAQELKHKKFEELLQDVKKGAEVPDIEAIEINRDDIQVNEDEITVEDSDIDFDEEYQTAFLTEFYRIMWDRIKFDEQTFHDFITHTKVFNKCFLLNNEKTTNRLFIDDQIKQLELLKESESIPRLSLGSKKLYKNCRYLETQIYPWLSQVSPVYHQLSSGREKLIISSAALLTTGDCYLNLYYKNLKGRGLVLTVSNDHISPLTRLLRVLAELGNTYPIELIHRGDLSSESIEIMKKAAIKTGQDLWLVDVSPAINEDYGDKFSGYGNKLLATMFNSFEEMMLIDADTVLLQSPENFFKLHKYVSSGALFFKDRAAVEYKNAYDVTFFKKLMNSQVDTILFNLPQVSDHSMKREFFTRRQAHYMESGVVLMNRKKHFHQPLVMTLLNSFTVVSLRIYGDKELFWLSLAFSGDENYEFNDNFAAAIGQVTPDEERKDKEHPERNPISKEICSNHPAHISDEDDHTILWFNSGFRHCGQNHKVDFDKEFEAKTRYWKFQNVDQFRTFFQDKLIIKHAIIPPHKVLTSDNDIGEPNVAWINMREYCAGYTWCGYSSIGNADKSKGEVGKLIEYSKEEQAVFERLGEVWIEQHD